MCEISGQAAGEVSSGICAPVTSAPTLRAAAFGWTGSAAGCPNSTVVFLLCSTGLSGVWAGRLQGF